jgi:plastocyanin
VETIKIIITGSNLAEPVIVNLSKGETQKTITNLPEGEKELESKGLDSTGNLLSHRKTNVTVINGQTVSAVINLGVTIFDTGFYPVTIKVKKGDKLYWLNNGSSLHTVTSSSSVFDSGDIQPGGEFSYTFSQEGTYNYYCKKNQKTGTVIVEGLVQPTPGATSTPSPSQTPSWKAVGTAGFTSDEVDSPSIFVYNGTPYIVFQDFTYASMLTVMKYTGQGTTGWENVGSPGFSSVAINPSIYVYNGTPYVAYMDIFNDMKSTVMKYTGQGTTGWENVGSPGFSPDYAAYLSLQISNGTPYIAFMDEGNDGKASLMKYTGQGTTGWENSGSPGFSESTAEYTSLFIYNDTPYVAYRDGNNSEKLTVMKYTGLGTTGWEIVGSPGFTGSSVEFLSLYIYNGTPYVSYSDYGSRNRASVMKYTGLGTTGWENVGVAGFSAGMVEFTSLQIYNGTPYVAYKDGGNSNKATLMKYTGIEPSGWENVGPAGFSAGEVDFLSFYLYNGLPYITYQDITKDSKATVMKFSDL